MATTGPSVAHFGKRLREEFSALADKGRAEGAAAYMRNLFPFYGIATSERRLVVRELEKEIGFPDDLLSLAEKLWNEDEREYQYAAYDILERKRKTLGLEHLPVIEKLITQKSWWDTVDVLAPRIAGPILRTEPQALRDLTHKWIESENFWLQRSAIIVQLSYKGDTDRELLFHHIKRRASSKEFFVRKGAGWALRELSKTDHNAVRTFVANHRDVLSPLTIREGTKYVSM
ncbi:MAG: DNA alkylation repair protein [bacterium]|nr:DNA alkylation repair protein [bacterium]